MDWCPHRPAAAAPATRKTTHAKTPRVRDLSIVLFLSISFLFLSSPSVHASAFPEATLLGFTFTFDGKEYDPATDESTWRYTVTGPMVSGPTYKDLSHWILALCAPHEVVEASGHKWERRSNPDPHHGLIGIKWDDKVSKEGSASFHFVLKGDWAVDMSLAVAAKAGQGKESGVLPGPGCQGDSCRIDYNVSTRSDWRFLKPGEYTTVLTRVDVQGDTGVRLGFADFGDAAYRNPWASSPDIYFEYSVGVTLDDADAFGWYPAAGFNGEEVVIPKAVVAQGARVNVWARALVTKANLSSEYGGRGRVEVQLLCD